MPFQTVLFDWDGTLCDSGAALYRAFEKSMAEFGVSFSLADYQAVYTPAWYRMYEAFGLPRARQASRPTPLNYNRGIVPAKTFYIETFGCQMNAHDSEK